MTSIIISGCCGKMGETVANEIKKRSDCMIEAGVDIHFKECKDYKTTTDFIGLKADVLVDFSNPKTLPNILKYGTQTETPLVLATTGYSEQDIENIKKASEKTAIFHTSNMSMGVNLMVDLAKEATAILGDSFDIEIVEKHHNQKIDSPSGTALMIANDLNEATNNKYHYEYSRHNMHKKREKNEIGIHSVRGGTIAGEHKIIFAGDDEILEITHTALSRKIFANGAINAALFIVNQKAGLYNMDSLIEFNKQGGRK